MLADSSSEEEAQSAEEGDEEWLDDELFDDDEEEVVDEDAGPSTDLGWSGDYSMFKGVKETFQEQTGPRIEGTTLSGSFTQFWDRPFIDSIVAETNKYAWEFIAAANETVALPPHSRVHVWEETSVDEIYRLISVMILMGFCVRGRIEEYFSLGILGMLDFRKLMSKNRFLLLMKFLHFVDNRCIIPGDNKKIAKIQPVV